jgi:uncharacterized protein (TIGR02453 family)
LIGKTGSPANKAAAFSGYPPEALTFLRELAVNNEKAWFEAHRATYEAAVKQPTAALVEAVSDALRQEGLPLEGAPKRSAFRIHRDVRFSKDKSPYKTNVGTVWYRQGSGKDGAGILYFHLAPTGCFAAAAFYMPEPDVLGAIRERIRVHPDRFLQMTQALAERGLQLDAMDTLSRMPKGFEDLAGAPFAAALKLKSFLVRRAITAKEAQSPALVSLITRLAGDALPLLQFGWAAIDEVRSS